jgi:hypothetical protein
LVRPREPHHFEGEGFVGVLDRQPTKESTRGR